MKLINWIFILLGVSAINASSEKCKPIQNFQPDRYLGKWYEIARMPVSFEEGLEKVTATYTKREDGKIEVVNTGIQSKNGKRQIAKGKAKFADSPSIGHLKVSFFWIFYADYIIVKLDPNYEYALVCGGSLKYFWILSRTPKLDSTLLNELIDFAKSLGYDTSKLILTKQE